jgi:hypothetical protein
VGLRGTAGPKRKPKKPQPRAAVPQVHGVLKPHSRGHLNPNELKHRLVRDPGAVPHVDGRS